MDQSVHLPSDGAPLGLIPPRTDATLRDLSAFTLGMEGRLYRVVAAVAPSDEPDSASGPAVVLAQPEARPGH